MSNPVNEIIQGDALQVLKTLPDNYVQCVVTSPPYYGLRDYGVDGQIGLEETPQEFVAKLVDVFREVRRVLRPDGTCWINIGDTYSSGSKKHTGRNETDRETPGGDGGSFNGGNSSKARVGTNLCNSLESLIKSQPLFIGNATTIRITSKCGNVPLHDNRFPYGVFLSLLGIERITIKQRDNDFYQVFNILDNECYCWVGCPVASCRIMDMTNLEIVFDVTDGISIVISDHDTNAQSILGVTGICSTRSSVKSDSSFSIEEASEPVTKCIRDIEPTGDAVTFNTPLKRFPDIYLVNDSIALRDGLNTPTSYSGNFCVTQASSEKFCFSLENCGVEISTAMISHLFTPNSFGSFVRYKELYDKAQRIANTLRPKQLLGIPDMLKRALMEDGWICRSSIIWHKLTAMPESVTDRPTTAHEHVFLLAKSERYFYDAEAIREPLKAKTYTTFGTKHREQGNDALGLVKSDNWGRTVTERRPKLNTAGEIAGANKRTVWSIASQPYNAAHFATMPPKLVEPCIMAGTSPRACEHCGACWQRVTVSTGHVNKREQGHTPYSNPTKSDSTGWAPTRRATDQWLPSCKCVNNTGSGKCIILDPFMGAGTVGLVALQQSRNYLGIELNPAYIELAMKRIATVQPTLWSGVGESEVSA